MTKRLLMTGNEAIAEAAIQAGCRFYAGYPITPQNEIPAYMAQHMPAVGGVFIQAESEIGAISMVMGAAACGARSMTSSSGPGISLKQEGISYLAGAQLPAVIVNMMRGGPGLGNIAPAQSDYFQATRGGGHGDYHCIVLAPSCVQEAYDLVFSAFDLADKYRNPVIILGDGMLGQVMEPIVVNGQWSMVNGTRKKPSTIDYRPSTKKWALAGCYGRKPNVVKSFYMQEGELEKSNLLLQEKYRRIGQNEARAEKHLLDDAEIIIVAYGTMARIAKGAVKEARERGRKVGLIRPISLWPFPAQILQQAANGSLRARRRLVILVVEMSYGQMIEDVRIALEGRVRIEFFGRAGGGIPTEEEIIKRVIEL